MEEFRIGLKALQKGPYSKTIGQHYHMGAIVTEQLGDNLVDAGMHQRLSTGQHEKAASRVTGFRCNLQYALRR
jgi:hypothetical protein